MRKFIALLTVVFVAFTLVFTSCTKPKGDFNLDNSVEYSMSADWCGYSMSVGAYGYNSYTVDAGGGTVEVYANGYGYWGSMYFDVPEGGSNTLYMYWDKKKSTPAAGLTKVKPYDVKPTGK